MVRRYPASVYKDYLKSAAWKEKRCKVIEREEGICEKCKAAPIDVVHHKTYENFGDEKLEDLAGLCKPCHDKIHYYKLLKKRENKCRYCCCTIRKKRHRPFCSHRCRRLYTKEQTRLSKKTS